MSAIGVFDSGVGGLTVLKSLSQAFPQESFQYLGDCARLPYGSKSPETIQKYCQQNMNYLLTKNVKAIVIACNSASAHWHLEQWQGIPVYNVIDPGVKKSLMSTKNKRIGVLGTRATILSQAYESRLKQHQVQVFSQACPLFVPLVEEGWVDDPLTNLVVYRYLQPLLQNQIDTLILGCTHYPVLQNAIQKVAGPSVTLVDSGSSVSDVLALDFASGVLAKNSSGKAEIDLHFTDLSAHLENLTIQLLAGISFHSLDKVDLF
jgi:glutamate racemase